MRVDACTTGLGGIDRRGRNATERTFRLRLDAAWDTQCVRNTFSKPRASYGNARLCRRHGGVVHRLL